MRVLVIDDDEMNRRVINDMLSISVGRVDEADGGKTGLEAMHREHYDLVMLDLRMPQMDGFDVLRTMRSKEDELAKLPVIVITADASPGLEKQCYEAGANAVMYKPILMQAMFDTMADVLESVD